VKDLAVALALRLSPLTPTPCLFHAIIYPSMPTASSTTDAFQFTSLEWDADTNSYHAAARQLMNTQGRWLTPDPYPGSYSWANPQSLNRYAYVSNNPMAFVDPSGELAEGPAVYVGTTICGPECGLIGGAIAGIATLGAIIDDLFHKPAFHGSTSPRPSGDPMNESLGLPTDLPGISVPWLHPLAPFSVSSLGLPINTGCEFGACGGGGSPFAGGGGNPSTQIKSLYDNILEHLEKIAADPNNPAVQHWKAEIENWTKQIMTKAGKRPGDLDKYLLRIIGISGSDLGSILGSPIIMVNPCIMNPLAPYCNKRPYNGPA